jgi:hypothetical protein
VNKPVTKLEPEVEVASPADPLALLRRPFADHHISKLPKPTKAQTDAVKANFKEGIRCKICGSWHHPEVVHLDYVGHAALTDRLLDADPMWFWEPVAFNDAGLPAFDGTGGLWIRLTVAGVTRLGYGHAAAKNGQDPGAREKEVIGDALRNAAMRFGAALDLWHKGDLHADEAPAEVCTPQQAEDMALNLLRGCGNKEMFADAWGKNKDGWRRALGEESYRRLVVEMKRLAANFAEPAPPPQPEPALAFGDDEIPY